MDVAHNTQKAEVAGTCLKCAVCCVFLSSLVKLGAVFSVHTAFLTAEIVYKKMWNLRYAQIVM